MKILKTDTKKAIDVGDSEAVSYTHLLNKDREKGLLNIVNLAQKFMGSNFRSEAYEGAKKMIQNPDSKWMRYVNRLLDETDPHVAKMTALNLGYQAAFAGTKKIRKMREIENCNIPVSYTHLYVYKRQGRNMICGRSSTFLTESMGAVSYTHLLDDIYALASVDVKEKEPGLQELAQHLRVPFVVFSAGELKKVPGDFTASAFVAQTVGVDLSLIHIC